MAVDKLVDSTQLDADLTSVANAIRTKGGTSADLAFPSEFVTAIQNIPSGGVTPTGTKQISISSNGTTTEDVTNYANAEITVAVPNSYSVGDEGKVVSNGALVSQSSATYTTNNTYDTTLINSVTVNVSGGGNDNYILKFENFKFNSSKWILNGCLLNPLKNGGCVHITYTKQNTGSADAQLICFGIGALSNWSPGASTAAYVLDYKSGNANVAIRFRGTNIDGTLLLNSFADGNGEFDVKLYADRIVNVKTGTSNPLTDYSAAIQSAMTSLSSPTYLSVGTNQTAPVSGIIQTLFAFESS